MVGLSLAPKSRGARIRECVYVGLVLVGGGVGGWGWGGWLCGPVVHVPLGGSTEGARPSWRPMASPVVASDGVAAPMASPAPVTIGSRCPAQPVDYRTGQSVV